MDINQSFAYTCHHSRRWCAQWQAFETVTRYSSFCRGQVGAWCVKKRRDNVNEISNQLSARASESWSPAKQLRRSDWEWESELATQVAKLSRHINHGNQPHQPSQIYACCSPPGTWLALIRSPHYSMLLKTVALVLGLAATVGACSLFVILFVYVYFDRSNALHSNCYIDVFACSGWDKLRNLLGCAFLLCF